MADSPEPIVAKATDSVGVTRKYRRSPPLWRAAAWAVLSLDDYVTAKALDGLFATIGEQEQSIRQNPAARSTALLKKVFGSR